MRYFSYLFLSCAALATTSCSKNSEPAPTTSGGSKDYQVEYRVSSTSDGVANHLYYTNATGGTTTLDKVPLPVSYAFKRTMKKGDSMLLFATIAAGGTATSNITVSILLDGKELSRETGTGTSAQAVPVWVITE